MRPVGEEECKGGGEVRDKADGGGSYVDKNSHKPALHFSRRQTIRSYLAFKGQA